MTALRALPDLSWQRVEFWIRQTLRDLDFRGLRVLDVGAGDGVFSCYIALQGADAVVGLEPELDGSSARAMATMRRRVQELGLDNVECRSETFQTYAAPEKSFDVVLAHNVINHLDEEAVQVLHQSDPARRAYAALLRKMYGLLRPGGVAVIADCARDNFFGRLGVRNPIAPTIEWHKHQNPEVWTRLLGEVGFVDTELHWTYPRRLRALGPLLRQRAVSYLCDSHFVIHARRAARADARA